MITTSDIGDILFRDCKAFGIKEVYRKGNIAEVPVGGLKAERVVILPKSQTPEKTWIKDFVEVNLCVPDTKAGSANLSRLQQLERTAKGMFDHVTGIFDGTRYHYRIAEIDGTVKDSEAKCHYVNVRLLFQVLNVN